MKSLQLNVPMIEQFFRSCDETLVGRVLERVVAYELLVPRFDMEVSETQISELSTSGANRREEYHRLAVMFANVSTSNLPMNYPPMSLVLRSLLI